MRKISALSVFFVFLYEIDELFDYAGYGESIVENNDGEFVEGLGFVCMEEGYTLGDVLQDTDQGMGGM